ncbi:transposase [Mariniflexile litorale]|uniref:Transposase n=1 Tax=Mariniflexile litorale TaxID=3045158 RepID=A0AAU7ECK9_9FLAO|nr:transposase [Mariniflexile sp. KMM 9835]MDQ8210398.1 transposase [Mariniflexile sp. KMM 9835]
MYKKDKVIRRYNEPFKLKILAKFTTGKHTKSKLCKLYSIVTTVNEWIKKYNRKFILVLPDGIGRGLYLNFIRVKNFDDLFLKTHKELNETKKN